MFMEKLKLDGRVAVVTGGGRSIGLSCCRALAEAGAKVVIADFDARVAEAGQAELKKEGFDTDTVLMDVTKPDQVEKAAAELEKRHGHVDILVANAGIARGALILEVNRKPVTSPEQIKQALQDNPGKPLLLLVRHKDATRYLALKPE